MSNCANTILAVEDSPILLTTLRFSLEKNGYQVKTATNGQEALDVFKTEAIDLILMDADMPILDGISACEKIRAAESDRNIPVIMVTSYGERDWVDRAYAAGVTDYVMKPINWDVLRNRIKYILSAKRAEEALFDEKEKAQITLESIGDGVITTNADQIVEYLNPIASKITGWSIEQARGQQLSCVFKLINKKNQQRLAVNYAERNVALEPQILLQHKDKKQTFVIEHNASPLKNRDGKSIGMVLVFHDITEKQRMAENIAHQASHDTLTQLYNRREFESRLNHACNEAETQQRLHSLLYLDLDRFKIVNDTCGHKAGDVLLQQLSRLMEKQVRKGDVVARLGGDEFGFLLQYCPGEKAVGIANHICQQIANFKFSWDSHIFSVGASIGLIEINHKQHNQNKLLIMADHASLSAKRAGKGQVHVYEAAIDEHKNEQIHWLDSIKEGLDQDKFCLLQQNIYNLDGQIRGHEIFLRLYRKESEELLLPSSFMSAAERYELSQEIDCWVIAKLSEWLKKNAARIPEQEFFSININHHSLRDPTFADFVAQKLQQQPLNLDCFCFEFNEYAFSTELEGLHNFAKKLKPLGCRFSLDQFGTGAIVLGRLKSLPFFDFVKISAELTQQILEDQVDKTIVSAIQQVVENLGMKTIATNIEDPENLLPALRELHINYAQGYGLSHLKPLTHMLQQS